MASMGFLDKGFKAFITSLIREYGIGLNEEVSCIVEKGIDYKLPSNEYALVRGPEFMLTCIFRGVKGQVFTVYPQGFKGSVEEVVSLDLDSFADRSVFYAFSNALLRYLGLVDRTIHCREYEPVLCGEKLYEYLARVLGSRAVLHVGYQPGHVEVLTKYYRDNLLVSDLRSDSVWRVKYGRLVYDGVYNDKYLSIVDTVLVTASSVVNKTFWDILARSYVLNKTIIVYGVSAQAINYYINKYTPIKTHLFCPYAR